MTQKKDNLVKLENAGVYKSSKWLVRGVSLDIYKGQIVTLIGPNGSGKTTTAKMLLNIPIIIILNYPIQDNYSTLKSPYLYR